MMLIAVFIESYALFLAFIFAVGVVHKLRRLDEFVGIVASYKIAPAGFSLVAALCVIATEAVSFLLLMAWPKIGAGAFAPASAVLSVYAAMLTINYVRGNRDIECGCSWTTNANSASSITYGHIIRTAGLAFITCCASFVASSVSAAPLQSVDILVAALIASPAAIAYAGADRLLSIAGAEAARRAL